MRVCVLAGIIVDSVFFFSLSLAMEERVPFVHNPKVPAYSANKFLQGAPFVAVDAHGFNPLHDIARRETVPQSLFEDARTLIREERADPAAEDDYKNTPAHYAAVHGHRELLFMLLNAVEARGSTEKETIGELSKSLVTLASDPLSKEILQLCTVPKTVAIFKPVDSDMLKVFQRVFVAKEKEPHTYQYFFNHVSVYARDAINNYSALYCAVLLKAIGECQLLLERQAQPNLQDSLLKFSVLARAVEQGLPPAVAEDLIVHGAAVEAPTQSKATLLELVLAVDPALRRIINDAIIKSIKVRRLAIRHYKVQGDTAIAAEQKKQLASDFACPLCKGHAGTLEFINNKEDCGHVLCKACREGQAGWGQTCPWCPQQRVAALNS